jgi:NAD(P)-dependent dehydrogenase (short-subunit alcohol dehydrogenase family)
MAQVWLVTGSSRGLGCAIVEAGLAAGNKVLATARDIESLHDLSERHGEIETNLFGTIIVTKAALPYFRQRKAGHFVQFSSMGGRIGPQGVGPIRLRNGVSRVSQKCCRAKWRR